MQLFARCGTLRTVVLSVPHAGTFADVRLALLHKEPSLAACSDLVRKYHCIACLDRAAPDKQNAAHARRHLVALGRLLMSLAQLWCNCLQLEGSLRVYTICLAETCCICAWLSLHKSFSLSAPRFAAAPLLLG